MEKELEKQQQYASKVLAVIKDGLVVEYPFLARAVYELKQSFVEGFHAGTDGTAFLCSAGYLLKKYLSDKEEVEELFLHSILHCVYLHPFLCKEREQDLWNLSCDIFVYYLIRLLDAGNVHQTEQREAVLAVLEKEIKTLSAQSIYRYFLHHVDILGMDVRELLAVFEVDEHIPWYEEKRERQQKSGSGEGSAKEADDEENEGESQDAESEDGKSRNAQGEKENGEDRAAQREGEKVRKNAKTSESGKTKENRAECIRRWSDIAEHAEAGLAMNLEKRIREFGDRAGSFLESLQNIRGEHKKYSEFLKQFAVLEERMLLDMDTFDYIYYTYGMELYKDTPLIEPLEYKEVKTIHEFVIAIDTSGSCDIDLIRKFLMKTYDILSDVTIFEGELRIYLFQCDAKIQQEKVIHDMKEMQEYTEQLDIYGRGGTDFRPVFERVQELREEKKLIHVRGLLYFTDGYGTYPKLPTDYKTAFVFAQMDEKAEVPSWAMKVYIEDETDL